MVTSHYLKGRISNGAYAPVATIKESQTCMGTGGKSIDTGNVFSWVKMNKTFSELFCKVITIGFLKI